MPNLLNPEYLAFLGRIVYTNAAAQNASWNIRSGTYASSIREELEGAFPFSPDKDAGPATPQVANKEEASP